MNDIEFDKFLSATAAIKDVLFMYKTLIEYFGLFDDFGTEDGTFDPEEFINCKPDDYFLDIEDAKLLNEGSAIKLICSVYQAWSQGGYPKSHCESAERAKRLLEKGSLNHMPYLEETLRISLVSIKDAESLYFKPVFDRYVLGYFKSLTNL